MPDALAGRVVEAPFPQPGAPVTARLVPASASNGRCLLLLHPPGEPAGGVGRVYVEYRVPEGWDAGMDPLGASLSREGVVVHSVVDIANTGPRVWYRGAVPTHSPDTDVTVATTPLVVRTVAADPDRRWVDVSVTAGAVSAAEIVRGLQSDGVVGPVGDLQETRTPCGDPVRRGTFATATTAAFGVRSTGFGGSGVPVDPQPTVSWSVGGVPVAAPGGTVDVHVDGAVFTLDYTVEPETAELVLTSRGGERYETPAVVTVSGGGTTSSATAVFTAPGWVEGIHPDDVAKLGDCLARVAQRYQRMPAPFRRPTPEPPWSDLNTRRIAERAWLRRAFRLIAEPPDLDAVGREGEDATRPGPGGEHPEGGARPTASDPGHPLLPHDDTDPLTARLHDAVAGFVDAPRDAVREADHVLRELAERFADAVTERRRTLRRSWQTGDGEHAAATDTEQLRLALRDYRELADRLLHV